MQWPATVVALGIDRKTHLRGRHAEFLHHGVAVKYADSGVDALVQLGREPQVTAVLIGPGCADADIDQLVEVMSGIGNTPVVVAVSRQASELPASSRAGDVESLLLPVSPQRLAQAVAAVHHSAGEVRDVHRAAGITIDRDACVAVWHGERIRLSPALLEMLTYLADAYPRVVSAEELASECRSSGEPTSAARVRVGIGRLREAFRAAAIDADVPVVTVRGSGYTLAAVREDTSVSAGN
ncbi:winged helix-turn-helix domain-containing protein [Demequina flava]|uniref:winged helix-turn-helix domain-containing protein n=1 Tax=Demequina flava TaxID=1095025 RepID=UPI001364B3B2|nr:winged helix-turn-helix domain-containing protein [Demequina flava]